MKTAPEPETLATIADRLGITIESSAPRGEVEPAQSKGSKPWPHIAYDVTLKRNGRSVWSGPYRLGVGHVTIPKRFEDNPRGLEKDEVYALNTLRAKPYATLADPALAASVAAKLAKVQKVTPKLTDVVYSLLMDGSAYFDAATFEDWCDEYGYDTDSRKAETIWKTCDEIGRNLARAFTLQELGELREAASNY